ncbi:hypothetical protein AcV7_007173 [Taiwanofungus camphoratus]|nr:hypothetical protein AcV7_007173 [Antrodia cinnamomea]
MQTVLKLFLIFSLSPSCGVFFSALLLLRVHPLRLGYRKQIMSHCESIAALSPLYPAISSVPNLHCIRFSKSRFPILAIWMDDLGPSLLVCYTPCPPTLKLPFFKLGH